MEEIWGKSPRGRSAAYYWLYQKLGRSIHFADLNETKDHETLIKAYTLLKQKSFQVVAREYVDVGTVEWIYEKETKKRNKQTRRYRQLMED